MLQIYKEQLADQIIKSFLNSLNSEQTKNQYSKSIWEFLYFTHGTLELRISDLILDPIHALNFYNFNLERYKNKEIKASTFNAKIKGASRFYDFLIANTSSNTKNIQLIKINPFANIKQIKEKDIEGSEPFTKEEMLMMIQHPYGSNDHIRLRNKLLFILGITTGIRCSALLNLTMDDIKHKEGVYYIDTVDKGGTPIKSAITMYYDVLNDWYNEDLKLRGYDTALVNDNGKTPKIFNIHKNSANRIIKQWVESLGICKGKKISFHSLRTTTCNEIFLNTGSIDQAQMCLNHKDNRTTKYYLDKANDIKHQGENIVSSLIQDQDLLVKLSLLSKEEIINKLMLLNEDTKKALAELI